MITPDMIRKMQTVIDAFVKAWVDDDGDEAEVIAAVLNAWPGGHSFTMVPRIVLPLPQESGDD